MLLFFCLNIPDFKAFHILNNYLCAQDEQGSCKAVLQKWKEYFMQPKKKKVILLNHAIFKQSTQGKNILFSEVALPLLFWTKNWTIQEMLKEHELWIVTAFLAK